MDLRLKAFNLSEQIEELPQKKAQENVNIFVASEDGKAHDASQHDCTKQSRQFRIGTRPASVAENCLIELAYGRATDAHRQEEDKIIAIQNERQPYTSPRTALVYSPNIFCVPLYFVNKTNINNFLDIHREISKAKLDLGIVELGGGPFPLQTYNKIEKELVELRWRAFKLSVQIGDQPYEKILSARDINGKIGPGTFKAESQRLSSQLQALNVLLATELLRDPRSANIEFANYLGTFCRSRNMNACRLIYQALDKHNKLFFWEVYKERMPSFVSAHAVQDYGMDFLTKSE